MAEREHSVVYRAIAEFDDARKKAREFRDELRALKAEQEGLNRGTSSSAQQAETAQRRLTATTAENARVTRDAATAQEEAARGIRNTTREMGELGRETERTKEKFRSIRTIGRNFGSEFSRQLQLLSTEMRRAWREADAGETAFQKLRRAMSAAGGGGNAGGFFTTLAGGADNLGRSITRVLSRFTFWPTIILAAASAAGPLVAVLGSLSAVALGAGSALVSLGGAVAALPGLVFSAATGIGAMVAAIAPLAGALKAYQQAQDATATAARRSGQEQAQQAERIRTASRGVEQANRGVVEAERSLVEARRGVIEASRGVEEAQYDVARAAREVEDAEYNLAEANYEARRAQLEVNEAREDALRDLQDLRREVERSSLTEERAVLSLARAQSEYARVMSDPTSSLIDRREALLRVREAENDLSDVRRRNTDNAKQLREEEAKGVEGSDRVVDAKKAAADAARRQRDAEIAVVDAQRGLVQAQRRVADAQQAVADAQVRVSDAEYRLSESRRNVADAERRLAEAQRGTAQAGSAAATAQAKYQEALDKLSPAARTVLLALIDMREEWGNISKTVQQSLFQPVVGQLGNLRSLLPVVENLLSRSAGAIGEVAARGIAMISSGPWSRDFAAQAESNARYIENLGDAGLYLLDALRHITRAADPFTTWLTDALKQGAANFADWAKSARDSGAIERFLEVTKRRLQEVWQITKNVGATLVSWAEAAEPFTDWMMARLQDLTQRWRDVAKAQESATSPLQKYLQDVRPLLSEVGRLFGDISRGLASAASDTTNIERAIGLLQSLREDVLPAIARVLRELGESGVDQAIVDAIASILDAIATFLDSGGGQALSTFVTVLAGFLQVLAGFASLPVVSHIIGAIAVSLAAVAAVSIVARFTGLFRIVDAFRWFVANRGNLLGSLTDAARGMAGLDRASRGGSDPFAGLDPAENPRRRGTPGGGADLDGLDRAQRNVNTSARNAAGGVGVFSRALGGLRTAASTTRTGLLSIASFLGGPWGIALAGASVAIGVLATASMNYNNTVKGLAESLGMLGDRYDELTASGNAAAAGTDEAIRGIINNNPDLQQAVIVLDGLGVGFDQLARAAANGGGDMQEVLSVLDREIDVVGDKWRKTPLPWGEGDRLTDRLKLLRQLRESLVNNADAMQTATKANDIMTESSRRSQELDSVFANFIGPVSIDTRERLALQYDRNAEKIKVLTNYVDVLGNSESTAADKADAMRQVIENQTGSVERGIEAAETWSSRLLDLEDSVKANGRSLDMHSRAGLRNRDALQAAAKSARELYLQDIASGVPMDEATRRHEQRIKRLKEEARENFNNKKETDKLIETYGDVPENLKTNILTDEKGFQAVYAELLRLQTMQEALKKGLSPEAAEKLWVSESSKLYRRPPTTGDGYGIKGYKTGGPVYGAGTRSSDSIPAWLSNGEFVQPTDVVEHYGVPVMEALRSRKLDKRTIQEALPEAQPFRHGGHVGCDCHDGAPKFARGGTIRVPIRVNPKFTKVDKDWVDDGVGGGDLGDGSGPGGWKWQMRVLRQAFPNLRLISGYRPGSRTLSGNRSYHSLGRAVDLDPSRAVAKWIHDNYGRKTKELITPFQDLNLHNGRPHRYTGAVWNQHNWAGGNAHVHWAFRQGGLVPSYNPMDMFGFPSLNMNSMVSPTAMPNPSSSQLSQAAQSVINQNRGITVENLNVTNPIPERASDSLSRQVTKLAVLGDI